MDRHALLRPSRRDAIAALAGLPALSALAAALAGCGGREKPRAFTGRIAGGDAKNAHRLRTRDLLSRPAVRTERVGTAILGAGISGLSAAWTLARAGETDFRVLELEPEPGGTSVSGRNGVSRYPWAAHYVPAPAGENLALETLLEEVGAVESRDASGRPVWAEDALIREPEERLFFRGFWYPGLYPRVGASREDLDQFFRFEREMHRYASLRDASGRRAFAIPRRRSSTDADLTSLDRTSMAEWMRERGYTSPRLVWFVEYGCRDDFGSSLSQTSAWAGIHYFAARLVGASLEEDPAPFLTWPEGNGRIVSKLAESARGRLATSALVFDAVPREGPAPGVTVRYLDLARDEVVALEAEHAVYALPKLTAPFVLAPWREERPAFLSAFDYAPWLVANLTLSERPAARGAPLAWDNVLYDSKGLGYVVATHQTGSDHGPTVLTYYLALAGEDSAAARGRLLTASWEDLAATVLADLTTAHPDLPGLVTNLDVWLWGHAMGRPSPGLLFNGALEEASRPLGRILFAHADQSGIPLLEESQDAGVGAAEEILRSRGRAFRSLLTN